MSTELIAIGNLTRSGTIGIRSARRNQTCADVGTGA